MRITAVICTLNRADCLRQAIRSLSNQTLSRDQYEILIVDNGSTDDTRQLVSKESLEILNLRYVYEPVQGLSRSRNVGWNRAEGEYIAYLDDDAVASSAWLEKILEVFGTATPKPGCVGGKVQPIWEAFRPPWLSKTMTGYLTTLDLSGTPITLDDTQWLAGTNIAFPRHVLEAMGGFQIDLGRKGNSLLSMEEILLQRQLQRGGYCCFYHPEIVVKHHVPVSRLTQEWFIRRLYWQGVSEAIVRVQRDSLAPRKRFGIGMSIVRARLLSRYHVATLVSPTLNAKLFEEKCALWRDIGHVLGLWGIAG